MNILINNQLLLLSNIVIFSLSNIYNTCLFNACYLHLTYLVQLFNIKKQGTYVILFIIKRIKYVYCLYANKSTNKKLQLLLTFFYYVVYCESITISHFISVVIFWKLDYYTVDICIFMLVQTMAACGK